MSAFDLDFTRPCGCKILCDNDGFVRMEQCNLHRYADDMLDALGFILSRLYDPNKPMVRQVLYSDSPSPDGAKTVRCFLKDLISKIHPKSCTCRFCGVELNLKSSEEILLRIQNYLGNGGLFNPEMMEHDKVRELIMDCRKEIERLQFNL